MPSTSDWSMYLLMIINVVWLILQLLEMKPSAMDSDRRFFYDLPRYHVDIPDVVKLGHVEEKRVPIVQVSAEKTRSHVDVFYHLFLKSEKDKERVTKIVRDQFQFLLPNVHRNVFVTNVGAKLQGVTDISDVATIGVINHFPTGPELLSLHEMWEHCHHTPEALVVYIHSKGSFHNSEDNEKLRQATTMSALSEECANLPETCDVCAMRMSPFPHAHTPGNMFLARCSYVRKLLDPATFDKVMGETDSTYYGTGRFAAEHWVLSHPSARSCDLFEETSYIYGYDRVPTVQELAKNFSLAKAPRFPLHVTIPASGRSRRIQKQYPSFGDRIDEYKRLYGQEPSPDWWGWDFFERKGNVSDAFPPRLFRPSG